MKTNSLGTFFFPFGWFLPSRNFVTFCKCCLIKHSGFGSKREGEGDSGLLLWSPPLLREHLETSVDGWSLRSSSPALPALSSYVSSHRSCSACFSSFSNVHISISVLSQMTDVLPPEREKSAHLKWFPRTLGSCWRIYKSSKHNDYVSPVCSSYTCRASFSSLGRRPQSLASKR